MDISIHDEIPKDLTPLEEELLLLKNRDVMLRKAEDMIEIFRRRYKNDTN